MKLLRSKSASEIKTISYYCTDPERAYLRMLSCVKAAEKYICKIVTRNMYNKLIMLKVGTNEVVTTARRVIGRENEKLQEREMIRIMNIRKRNVEKEMKCCKYEWFKAKSAMKLYLNTEYTRKMYLKIERIHKQFVWNKKVTSSKKKVTFLGKKKEQRYHTGTREKQNMRRRAEKDMTNNKHMQKRNNKYYSVTDEELKTEEIRPIDKNYEVYGNITLSEPEENCLSLGPKYMVTPKIDKEDFEVEVEVECVKTRLEIAERERSKEEDGEINTEELESMKEEERKERQIFNKESGELSMSKLRVTDAKYNTRSFLPRETENEDEILIQARRLNVLSTFNEYMHRASDKRGERNNINMTKEQIQGKKSLLKRAREGELVITTTDKSGKFAVVETSIYKESANIHLNDEEITMKEVEDTETLMNRHASQIVKSLNMGTRHGKDGQVDRIRKAFRSVGAQPGPVQFLIKDHKKIEVGKQIPPTRQVCSAKGGPSSRLSNLVSTILNKAADATKSETECQSTEELKRGILDVNRDLMEKCKLDPGYRLSIQKAEIISLDVKALYPSLKIEEVKEILMEVLEKIQIEGKLTLNEVKYHEVGKYLSIVCTEEEIKKYDLEEAIPKKTAGNRGPRPGPAYWETDVREVYERGKKKEVSKWQEAEEPDERRKQKMISLMMTKAVEVIMKNHTYRFDGKIYKQKDGGPIGDEMSQAVARLVMIWYDEKFAKRCEEEGVKIILYKRYVDDTNMIVVPPKRLEERERAKEGTESQGNGKKVGELCRKIADTVSDMLKFEEDIGEKYADGKLPILDLKVWLEKEEQGVKIKHEFYKKPMTSKFTLKKGTAYPKSRIRAVMKEEVLRRLRNCSPEMTWEEKGVFLTEFAIEMRNSGHDEKFREEVMNRAVKKYEKDLEEHNSGKKNLYRNRKEREEECKQKGGKRTKDSWFRKKGGKDKERTTSILRVPYTRGVLKEEMDKTLSIAQKPEGTCTVAYEESGQKLHHMLVRPDPFPKEECGRAQCRTVVEGLEGGCRGTCWQQHVNYSIYCRKCEREREQGGNTDKSYVYVGESSRGCYKRFEGHRKSKHNGFMYKHAIEKHGGDLENDFVIKRERVDKDPMRRILRESIKIDNIEKDNNKLLMNSKEEHFGTQTIRANFSRDRL